LFDFQQISQSFSSLFSSFPLIQSHLILETMACWPMSL